MIEFLRQHWIGLLISAIVAILWIAGSIFLYRRLFKRIYDIIFALIGLPFFILLFIPIALLIKVSDRGPVFYCGKRTGKNGKVFGMKKFRSMKVNAPDIRLEDGATFSGKNDPRVTKIGRLLRATSLDETPQIIDILIGNMSFIGPRPDVPDVVEKLEGDDRLLLKVRPGLTGYSQAKFRNNIVYKEKIKYDCEYVKKISFFFDVKIFFWTIWTVLRRKGLHNEHTGKIDESTLEVLELESNSQIIDNQKSIEESIEADTVISE